MTSRGTRAYDLEERTSRFGRDVIRFAKSVPRNPVTAPLISQLVRSATSVGANYCEADNAESKKDFRHKLGICCKEARETGHWLRMVVEAVPELGVPARPLAQEARELNLILNASIRTATDKGGE